MSPFETVVDPGGPRGLSPGPVKISHKKMATECSYIDFMLLAPPYLVAGSSTVKYVRIPTVHLV